MPPQSLRERRRLWTAPQLNARPLGAPPRAFLSYDLHFVRVPRGQDVATAAEASLADAELGINRGPVDSEKETRKKAIAAALIAADPVLSVYPFDFAEIARLEGINEADARIRFRHLELNGPGDGGIQITLFDDSATLTVPYWHEGIAAREVWSEIWTCVQCLETHGEFRTYDPQLERAVEPHSDRERVLKKYLQGVAFTQRVAQDVTNSKAKRPWWKFWSAGA